MNCYAHSFLREWMRNIMPMPSVLNTARLNLKEFRCLFIG